MIAMVLMCVIKLVANTCIPGLTGITWNDNHWCFLSVSPPGIQL